MIDIEKYWIPYEDVIKEKHQELSFWDDMNKNGWELITSYGNLNSFYTHFWGSELYKNHFLLQVSEDDIGDFFLIPDRLQTIVKIWINANVPCYKNKKDCIQGKWQYQIDNGWFDNPHMCSEIRCKKCVENTQKRKENER